MPTSKTKIEDRIEKADIPFKEKVELYNSLKSLETSNSKLDKTLSGLADKLFTDSLDGETVAYFNDLVTTIKALTIDYNKLGHLQKISLIKMMGGTADKKMATEKLDSIYEKLISN